MSAYNLGSILLILALGGCSGTGGDDAGSDDAGSDEPCEAFFSTSQPMASDDPTMITVRNDSAAPIFMAMHSGAGSAVGFRRNGVRISQAGADTPLVTAPNVCDFACELFDNDECGNQCSDDGNPPGPIVLQPGETFSGTWSGLHFGQVQLPDRCLPDACSSGLECGRWLVAEAGDFTAGVTIANAWNCLDADCPCTMNNGGYCQVDGFDAQGGAVDPVTLSADFAFPGGVAELVWP